MHCGPHPGSNHESPAGEQLQCVAVCCMHFGMLCFLLHKQTFKGTQHTHKRSCNTMTTLHHTTTNFITLHNTVSHHKTLHHTATTHV
mmetsp:Transcript_68350/g.110976  ORF Transcript_68350/g.110976 Transcript_68350/m.110976 type:complete len:87 (-) Transcript_68350:101-361(-)